MVEVIQIHEYKDSYPFGLQKQTQRTYVQMIKQVQSQLHLQSYRNNLALFKSIDSSLIIKLDSYIKQNNQLQIYYEYEPLSMKSFVQQRLEQIIDDSRDHFLGKVINNINLAIEQVILLLTKNKMLAILSIDNIAIGQGQHVKFFIEPDFEIVDRPDKNQLEEYYSTETKKLQIQLQEFLQHIFATTGMKTQDQQKANFVIQGNKLVFVAQLPEVRQSNMIGVNSLGQVMKVGDKLGAIGKQLQNSTKLKFDIKNILDQKKLQKNQAQFNIPLNNKQLVNNSNGIQSPSVSFSNDNIVTNNSNTRREGIKKDKQQMQNKESQSKKQVRNYFENNDDFNKDASFYPEEFIKEDSIAEFQGYEDQLERELEDLKIIKLYEDENQQGVNPNRVSIMPNQPLPKLYDNQKMTKSPGYSQSTNQLSLTPQTSQPNNRQPTRMTSLKYPKTPSPSTTQQNVRLNQSNSQQQDTSTDHKKKKYKVTITTSHEVDVHDGDQANLKEIEREIIDDIRKGRMNNNQPNKELYSQNNSTKPLSDKESFNQNFPTNHIKGRETHNPSSSHQIYTNSTSPQSQRNTSLNSIGSNASSSVDELKVDEKPFSKQHPHVNYDQSQNLYSGREVKPELNAVNSNVSHPTHDIMKIIEKIKNNSQNQQNQQNQQNIALNQQSSTVNQQFNQTSPSTILTKPTPFQKAQKDYPSVSTPLSNQKQLPSLSQEDHRPHSHHSNHQVTKENPSITENKPQQQPLHDKEYYDKIQKAKMKAEEIMKLVKQRKVQ